MKLLAIITDLRIQDILDILFLSVVAYHLYLWFRGTKAFKAMVGLLALGLVFTVARAWGLFLTTWAFQILWQVLVILLIILFQSEIRQVLERVNPLKQFGLQKKRGGGAWTPAFSKAVFLLAERHIGALIIIERLDRVEELVTGGQELEGEPIPELLLSIFHTASPLHDGAAVIREGRLVRAGCFLPLSSAEGLPNSWGTRHRAALGLSERCDALVVVVSEERGDVAICRGGRFTATEAPAALDRRISAGFGPSPVAKRTWWKALPSMILAKWQGKLSALALVCLFWLLLAGQQDFEVVVNLPLTIKGVPETMEIVDPMNPSVRIRARGLRKDASMLNERNCMAQLDVSSVIYGRRVFFLRKDHISLPNDRVTIVDINPPQLAFTFKEDTGSPAPVNQRGASKDENGR